VAFTTNIAESNFRYTQPVIFAAKAKEHSVMARARHGSYLFKRDGSDKWWIKLRSGGQRIEKSLGTADRAHIHPRPRIKKMQFEETSKFLASPHAFCQMFRRRDTRGNSCNSAASAKRSGT
jgi:hypothetical protein